MTWRDGLVCATALGCATIAGVYFAFSTFIMQALAKQGESGAATIQVINEDIVRSGFMPLFLSTSLTCMVLAILGGLSFHTGEGRLLVAAALIYLLGMFGCTIAMNVPLNDRLASGYSILGELCGAMVLLELDSNSCIYRDERTYPLDVAFLRTPMPPNALQHLMVDDNSLGPSSLWERMSRQQCSR